MGFTKYIAPLIIFSLLLAGIILGIFADIFIGSLVLFPIGLIYIIIGAILGGLGIIGVGSRFIYNRRKGLPSSTPKFDKVNMVLIIGVLIVMFTGLGLILSMKASVPEPSNQSTTEPSQPSL